MKRTTLLYSTILSLGLLMGACAEDDGNYDYTPINSVTIEGLEEDLLVEAGSRLQLTPVLNITDESNINLSYEWTIGETVVSTERNLDIALPPLDYGEHLCALTIRDLDNGMQYRMTFSLTITNPFNYGYYFLTRMDDGSTEMAYIPANSEDASTAEDVMYATGVGEYPFGKEPAQIYGGYTYVNGTSCWQMTFLTKEGDNPVIITNNNTFQPMYLITDANFINEDQGYRFLPECTVVSMRQEQFFISQGQYIRYVDGKLYRPARHLQDYYWSHPVMGASGASFAWVFDELSKRIYSIAPYSSDNPELGIVADSYAYDEVTEPENNVTIDGTLLYASDAYSGGGHLFNAYAAESDGIHLYTFKKAVWNAKESTFSSETVLPLPGAGENTKIAAGTTGISNGMFYVGSGTEIYSSPTTLPTLSSFCTLPSDLGEVEYLGLSARGNRLVVVMYDENSSEERKGSVVYVDLSSHAVTHTFPHILHHCAGYWGANDSTSSGFGDFGDTL